MFNRDNPLGEIVRKTPFVVSLSNHERPFDRLRANGFGANGQSGLNPGHLALPVAGAIAATMLNATASATLIPSTAAERMPPA